MSQRRLPVYLLLDCSESMAGPAIEAVSRGLELLLTTLRANPLALETAYLSVITFSRYAKQVVPLTELASFQMPKLSVRAGTAYGAALDLLLKCLQREVVKTTATTKGDYKPLVFLMTDGQPTDAWEASADALRAANNPKIANIYAIGCGPDVDSDALRRITDVVIRMDEMSSDSWRKVFVWLSASVSSASTRFGGGGGQAPIDMPSLPAGLQVAPPGSERRLDPTPRQVFLPARCSRTKKPYLMRFARQGPHGRYEAIASHPLDELDDGDGDLLPPINSSMLSGCPGCPHCDHPIASMCSCGALFCDSPGSTVVTCPACNARLTFGGHGDFDIQRSHG